ncbi:MAG: hypothetical protein IBX50_17175 [Marinospirillum sp.]|uniref:hypothetical protein n=1 Tax=Marinospirillum sp. TaxID=2183934 RepID=UPI0019F6E76D|nr:hypothetical protein [Marinospirillum sp.]MBE0508424.1 hypothetical protein [Marinospirillum sp.]
MGFNIINPAEARQKRDFNPVKLGFDQKQNITVSLSSDAVERIGLLSDDETPIIQLGVDGKKIGIFAAPIGRSGFELKKTSGDLPRYTFSVPVEALFPDAADLVQAPFRARIMTSVSFEEHSGMKGVIVDAADHLFATAEPVIAEPEATEQSADHEPANTADQAEHDPDEYQQQENGEVFI